MLQQQTLTDLKSLGCHGMANELERQQQSPNVLQLPFDERLALLIAADTQERNQRKFLRMLKAAKLKLPNACIEDIDYRQSRGLDKAYIQSFLSCHWLAQNQYIVITGSTGGGKSYIANALAQLAIRNGYSALFYRFPRLLEDMEISRLDGSLPKLRTRLSKFKLLILDDWALSPLSANRQQDLLEIIEDRAGSGSMVITSQLPLDKWHEYIGEPTYADAIMDRIIHRSHRLELHGDSMRKVYGLKKEDTSC
jgi:DNA replication protein DnaC